MKKFKGIIFDMDGLLLDTEKLSLKAFQTTCLNLNLGDLSDLFKQCIGTTKELEIIILKKGLENITDHNEFLLSWHEEYKKIIIERPIQLKEGAEELLGYIRSINIPVAVATSTNTKAAKEKLSSCHILKYFNIVIGGDQVKLSKPNPEIYLKAASKIGAIASRCLAFEDSINGVKSASTAGMTVIQIPDLVQPSQEELKLGQIVLNNLSNALEYKF